MVYSVCVCVCVRERGGGRGEKSERNQENCEKMEVLSERLCKQDAMTEEQQL